jgi:hypothetical protein
MGQSGLQTYRNVDATTRVISEIYGVNGGCPPTTTLHYFSTWVPYPALEKYWFTEHQDFITTSMIHV